MQTKLLTKLWNPDLYNCPYVCTKFEYQGEIILSYDKRISKRRIGIGYWMATNEIRVQKEYLIHDLNGLVGFLGGTLSLFIGFSFYDILKYLMCAIEDFAFFIYRK